MVEVRHHGGKLSSFMAPIGIGVVRNDAYPEEDRIGIGLATGHPVHAKAFLKRLDEVLRLSPLVMQRNYLVRWLFPISGDGVVAVGIGVEELSLQLGPALHYQPEGLPY